PTWADSDTGAKAEAPLITPAPSENPAPPQQEITSAGTSLNQVPASFKAIDWERGTKNLDYGGGKYDTASDFLKNKGVTNEVYDPFNRTEKHNANVYNRFTKTPADTATIANVLNVIKEPAVRQNVLQEVASKVKPRGTVY